MLAAQREQTYARRAKVVHSTPEGASALLLEMSRAVVSDIFAANWKAAAELDEASAEPLIAKLRQFFPSLALDPAALAGAGRDAAEAAAASAVEASVAAKVAELDGMREGLAFETARYLSLLQTDNLWKEHMKAMNFVKDFAGLKVYAQQKPLDVYREEGLKLFEKMQAALRQNTVFSFFAYQPRA